jgi:hypothetical protein
MLTTAAVRAIVAELSYRPGWELRVEPEWEGWPHPTLGIRATVPDSTGEGDITLDIRSPVPPCSNVDQFLAWVRWRLQKVEAHECDEWLRYQSRRLNDPGHA